MQNLKSEVLNQKQARKPKSQIRKVSSFFVAGLFLVSSFRFQISSDRSERVC